MTQVKDLSDKERCEIVVEEIRRFEKLVGKHRRLLYEIGRL